MPFPTAPLLPKGGRRPEDGVTHTVHVARVAAHAAASVVKDDVCLVVIRENRQRIKNGYMYCYVLCCFENALPAAAAAVLWNALPACLLLQFSENALLLLLQFSENTPR